MIRKLKRKTKKKRGGGGIVKSAINAVINAASNAATKKANIPITTELTKKLNNPVNTKPTNAKNTNASIATVTPLNTKHTNAKNTSDSIATVNAKSVIPVSSKNTDGKPENTSIDKVKPSTQTSLSSLESNIDKKTEAYSKNIIQNIPSMFSFFPAGKIAQIIAKTIKKLETNLKLVNTISKAVVIYSNRYKELCKTENFNQYKEVFNKLCYLIKKNYNRKVGRNYSYIRMSDNIVKICHDIFYMNKQIELYNSTPIKKISDLISVLNTNKSKIINLYDNLKGNDVLKNQKDIEDLFIYKEKENTINCSYIILFLIHDMILQDYALKRGKNSSLKERFYTNPGDAIFLDNDSSEICQSEMFAYSQLGGEDTNKSAT